MSKESCFEIDMEPDKQIDAPSGRYHKRFECSYSL